MNRPKEAYIRAVQLKEKGIPTGVTFFIHDNAVLILILITSVFVIDYIVKNRGNK